MAEFTDVVRNRRMTRAFTSRSVDAEVIDGLVDLASRAPSAGKTQGWHLVVLEGAETRRFWDISLPAGRRSTFRWKHLLDAPVIALPLADATAYVERYAQDDKARTGLGDGVDAWPVPYWTIDTSMSVMTLLLAAEDVGLGALFFGVFHNEDEIRAEFDIPERLELLGALALGHPRRQVERLEPDDAAGTGGSGGSSDDEVAQYQSGRSATRPRRSSSEIIHRSGW